MTKLLYFVQLLIYLTAQEETSHLKFKTIQYYLEFINIWKKMMAVLQKPLFNVALSA